MKEFYLEWPLNSFSCEDVPYKADQLCLDYHAGKVIFPARKDCDSTLEPPVIEEDIETDLYLENDYRPELQNDSTSVEVSSSETHSEVSYIEENYDHTETDTIYSVIANETPEPPVIMTTEVPIYPATSNPLNANDDG